ncbi:8915_t:CDS:2 [Funneliformis geosporum]|nr:8915_t:CDS:2 [Funneliformis geosporum]
MNSHPKFQVMHTLLKAHCEEKVEYMSETKSKTINIIPRPEFTHLLVNLSLNQMFITSLKSNNITGVELEDEEFGFIYKRCVTIYMKNRQKTWRDINNYILEKGTASF